MPVAIPGCKSVSQRILLGASWASGTTRVHGLSPCQDTADLLQALKTLGLPMQDLGQGGLEITGWGGPPPKLPPEIAVGEGGTTLRFLLPLVSASHGETRLVGASSLFRRPHTPLLDFLQAKGARITPLADTSGFQVTADGLSSGVWKLPAQVSSQFASALWYPAQILPQVEVKVDDTMVSKAYFLLTQKYAKLSFAPIPADGYRSLSVPADPSGATFFEVASRLLNRPVCFDRPLEGGHPENEAHSFLKRFDTHPEEEEAVIDVQDFIDAAPALAVLGLFRKGGLTLTGIEGLRHKESDRVVGIQALGRTVGQEIKLIHSHSLHIPGGGLQGTPGTTFEPQDDHRLAMAAFLVQLLHPSLRVENAACVRKSFPDFVSTLTQWVSQ